MWGYAADEWAAEVGWEAKIASKRERSGINLQF